ncbi:MAG TPA: diacylglycerol kinase family protein [Gemmatimonadaceae bacterium]|nr:diacylglycerol kinase family protein [Gemmatimonadaceae bacterium]
MRESVRVIINPAAGRGRAARMIPEVLAKFSAIGVTDIVTTVAPGDETALTIEGIRNGCTTIVAGGGDGTSSAVANAILTTEINTRLAVLPLGTGNDFAKTLGTCGATIEAVAQRAVEHSTARVDVGHVEDTYFLNSCGFGFDVAVIERIGRMRWLRGDSVYIASALRELFGFRGSRIAVTSSAGTRETARHLLLVIANTPHFGGSFTIAPDASVTDGKLDSISVMDLRPHRRIGVLASAARGRHLRYAECRAEVAESFSLVFDVPPSYETDGELRRATTTILSVSCVPSALRVLTIA